MRLQGTTHGTILSEGTSNMPPSVTSVFCTKYHQRLPTRIRHFPYPFASKSSKELANPDCDDDSMRDTMLSAVSHSTGQLFQ